MRSTCPRISAVSCPNKGLHNIGVSASLHRGRLTALRRKRLKRPSGISGGLRLSLRPQRPSAPSLRRFISGSFLASAESAPLLRLRPLRPPLLSPLRSQRLPALSVLLRLACSAGARPLLASLAVPGAALRCASSPAEPRAGCSPPANPAPALSPAWRPPAPLPGARPTPPLPPD